MSHSIYSFSVHLPCITGAAIGSMWMRGHGCLRINFNFQKQAVGWTCSLKAADPWPAGEAHAGECLTPPPPIHQHVATEHRARRRLWAGSGQCPPVLPGNLGCSWLWGFSFLWGPNCFAQETCSGFPGKQSTSQPTAKCERKAPGVGVWGTGHWENANFRKNNPLNQLTPSPPHWPDASVCNNITETLCSLTLYNSQCSFIPFILFLFVFNFNKPFQRNKNSSENAPPQATYYLMD